jgi:hypothetical protein
LAICIAAALYADQDLAVLAAMEIQRELEQRIESGQLPVRNSVTLGVLTLPLGFTRLRSAVFLPWEARALLEERGIEVIEIEEPSGPVLWTLRKAGEALGAQEGWHQGTINGFIDRMLEAARQGALTVRDPQTDLPVTTLTVRDFYHLVMPRDVNAWLEVASVDYRWLPAKSGSDRTDAAIYPVPRNRSAVREQQALQALQDYGYDLLKLPKPAPGMPSEAKQLVRIQLKLTSDQTKSLWSALLRSKSIDYRD